MRQLWLLFTRTLKYGIAAHAFTVISGGYWSARFQADSVIQTVAGLKWFIDLFSDVEAGPLGQYFAGESAKKWDFKRAIKSDSSFIYWFATQVAVTVSRLE